ncbi:hypothetical protein [Desulfosporosinus sp. SB140]|uniref:hypothetical protein n=1 Tax=Desulfosporosinus paludis TaxID=3115649 RepID=UPI00388DC756
MEFDHETKKLLIDVLGEEMFNVCLENPEKAITFSWLFSFSIANFDKIYGIHSEISNKLLSVEETIGEDFCIWSANNFKELNKLRAILSSYIKNHEIIKKNQEKLKQLIQTINSTNYDAKIVPLITAFKINGGTNLVKLFQKAKISYVRDIKRLLTLTIDEKDKLDLYRFIRWLRDDRKAIILNNFQNLFSKSRNKDIVRERANGTTLQEISVIQRISRQRVRQIEKKMQSHFNDYVESFLPHYILYAFSENSGYISADEINEVFRDLSDLVIYCLKVCNCSSVQWCGEVKGFIIGDKKWYEQLKEFRKGLPEILDFESVDSLLGNITNHWTLPITFTDIKKIILRDYKLSGKVYFKKRMSLSEMYNIILEKYYPNGIELYNDSEAISFRNHVRGMFGDVYLPKNNRAIDVRLADLTISCDKGKRILPSGVKISLELLNKIHDDIIKSEQPEIMFSDLFERFKKELLLSTNISNRYFLQGLLRYTYSDEFVFSRYTLRKKNAG